jgi:hypothetical protein
MSILISFLPPLPLGLGDDEAVIVDRRTLYEGNVKDEALLVVVAVGLTAENMPTKRRIYEKIWSVERRT